MPILGDLLRKSVKLGGLVTLTKYSPGELQKRELQKLLRKAKNTQFGKENRFEIILNAFLFRKEPSYYYKIFTESVPINTYNKIFNEWWYKILDGEEDVTWPGKVKFFALSSGTSEAASKQIPITKDLLRAIKKTGTRQLISLKNFDIPADLFTKGVLMLGGSTDLYRQKDYYEGDLSGIMTSKLPFWFSYFYKPGKKIARTRDWNAKLDLITKKASSWDIGYIAGVPAWMLIMFERIIKHYKVKNIHEIWPNLSVFAHGGVSFEPYKKGFERLLGKPVIYIETYLASEGFLAYQDKPDMPMKLVLDNGIFFEFIPFNEENFDEDGEIILSPSTFLINQIEENKDYAILISTVAGAWRYLIGDTIKVLNKKTAEILITGRTKHYLSICGEHLSVDNMNKAMQQTCKDLNVSVREFAVAGVAYETLFAHKWYIGSDDVIDVVLFKAKLDAYLKEANDDYKTERDHGVKDIFINILPSVVFYDWLKQNGKEGGQNKFPRVLKKLKLDDWESYLGKLSFVTQPPYRTVHT